jgi:hypothetical protein
LAAATGVVLLFAGVGYVLANGNTSPASRPAPVGMPSKPTPLRAATQKGSIAASVGTRQLSYTRNGETFTYAAMTTKANFTSHNLAGKVRALAAPSLKVSSTPLPTTVPTTVPSASGGSKPTYYDERIGGFKISQLGGCLSRIAIGQQVVLAVLAHYQHVPAAIVVLRPTGDSALLNVIVAGFACSASDSDIITQTTIPSA